MTHSEKHLQSKLRQTEFHDGVFPTAAPNSQQCEDVWSLAIL